MKTNDEILEQIFQMFYDHLKETDYKHVSLFSDTDKSVDEMDVNDFCTTLGFRLAGFMYETNKLNNPRKMVDNEN